MKTTLFGLMWLCTMLVFAVVVYAADREIKPHHQQADIKCVDCHATKNPDSGAEEKACLSCHGSREDLTKLTEKLEANPHFGHEEGLTCNSCHREHEESILYCDDCHKWDLKTP